MTDEPNNSEVDQAPGPVPVSGGPKDEKGSPDRSRNWPPSTPIWFLDVDGVLNAVTGFPDLGVWSDYRSGHATAGGRRWPITWSPTVVDAVRAAHQSRAAEVLWLTTWEDDANGDLVELLDLPRFPVAGHAHATGSESTRSWWKLQVARQVHDVDPTRPLLWTDDDLSFDPEAAEWINSRGLGISPRTAQGLVAADLGAIQTFLSARSG